MTPVSIIPSLDIVEDSQACLGVALKAVTVQQLTLQGSEEALTHGIIVAVSHGPHRQPDTRLTAALAEGKRGVLSTMVGVMDNHLWPSLTEGHVQGLEHQFCP